MGRSAISTGNQGKNERDLSVILLHGGMREIWIDHRLPRSVVLRLVDCM
jgi:hypothetical protein